jgi:hypothetical protein
VSSPRGAGWRTGAAGVLAVLFAACSDALPTPPATGFLASGSVHSLAGPLPAGLTATVVSGASRVSAPVSASGTFSVQTAPESDSVDVIIAEATGGSVLPALVRVGGRTHATGLRVILVPRSWTINGGEYAGQTVAVSVDDAFRPPCTTAGDTNCDGFYPRAWATGIKLWPASRFPVPVAFDRTRTHGTISPADSVAFWTIVGRMNTDLGTAVFRPARLEELALNTAGTPTNGVAIRVDTTLTGFGAWTNWWWNSNGEMYAGVIRARAATGLLSSSLMTHELLHTQGFKHSCSWPTVMGGYGCGSTTRLSPADVAHAQLARAVLDAQRSTGAQHGLIAALQGERVVLRNLPLASFGSIERLRLMRSDSIGDGDHSHH